MENDNLHITGQAIVEFKKSLFGANKKEVYDYIDLLSQNLSKAREVYEEKLAELKSANELINYERDSQDEKIRQLTDEYEILLKERNELKKNLQNQQNLADDLHEVKSQNDELRERVENFRHIAEENRQLKKQMAENQAVCQMRERQEKELFTQIEALKQQNKAIMDSALEERNRRETQTTARNLALSRMLQMHRFALRQSRRSMESLVKQMEEACRTADGIDFEEPAESVEKDDQEAC